MIAIEIRHNGELKATCGADEFRQLAATVFVEYSDGETPKCEVECLGVVPRDENTEEVLRWVKKKVALGDEISFRIVEASESQAPFDTQLIRKHPPHV
jgi:hypothetical protein